MIAVGGSLFLFDSYPKAKGYKTNYKSNAKALMAS